MILGFDVTPAAGALRASLLAVVLVLVSCTPLSAPVTTERSPTLRSPTPSPSPPATAQAWRSVPPDCAQSEYEAFQGLIRVCPASAPVGAIVVVEGQNCVLPELETVRVGLRARTDPEGTGRVIGTFGSSALVSAELDTDRSFRLEVTVPETFSPRQGHGGGEVVPGGYEFYTVPPMCEVPFEVVGTK